MDYFENVRDSILVLSSKVMVAGLDLSKHSNLELMLCKHRLRICLMSLDEAKSNYDEALKKSKL